MILRGGPMDGCKTDTPVAANEVRIPHVGEWVGQYVYDRHGQYVRTDVTHSDARVWWEEQSALYLDYIFREV